LKKILCWLKFDLYLLWTEVRVGVQGSTREHQSRPSTTLVRIPARHSSSSAEEPKSWAKTVLRLNGVRGRNMGLLLT